MAKSVHMQCDICKKSTIYPNQELMDHAGWEITHQFGGNGVLDVCPNCADELGWD